MPWQSIQFKLPRIAPPAIVRAVVRFLTLLCCLAAFALPVRGQAPADSVILSFEGQVHTARAGTDTWQPARTNQVLKLGDRLRTGANSRATILCRWSKITYRVNERTLIEIQPPKQAAAKPTLNLMQGILYFFSRDKPQEINLSTPAASGAIRGTEFNLAAGQDGRTEMTMIEGQVELANEQGALTLTNGEQGIVEPNQAPRKTAVISTINIIQWALYYPAVLDPDELPLAEAEKTALAESLAAYRQGDLPAALAAYPEGRQPATEAEKVFYAGLLLAAGQVERAEKLLAEVGAESPPIRSLARALDILIAAVQGTGDNRDTETRKRGDAEKRRDGETETRSNSQSPIETNPKSTPPLTANRKSKIENQKSIMPTASECLADSYYLQARHQLAEALAAARQAVAQSPQFAFGWARVAELEFSHGRTREAQTALDKALQLAPRNGQALALKGFVLSAQNRIPEALGWFNRAIAADGALAHAWLGHGLCQIRQGKTDAGRDDLQTAALLEPQRAALRSYLAKALHLVGDLPRAQRELELARQFDPADPTPWLYSALFRQQKNQVNAAIHDLETSMELNDNRRVYRSQLLLDQDRAVRGANLASVYEDAGLTDVSVREASRAVNNDYANYSAHLFLANSYNALRDPRQVNLRYETPAMSEFLLANLLAPAQAGALSPQVSYQEYSRLFERNRVGLASTTEYLSRGDWRQAAAQYAQFGGTSIALDEGWWGLNGDRPNNDFEQTTVTLRLKQEVSPRDSLYLQAIYSASEAGDVARYYDPTQYYSRLRSKETQEPLLLLGYHHEWAPGSHTLFLASRLQDKLWVSNPDQPVLLQAKLAAGGPIIGLPHPPGPPWPTAPLEYRSDLEGYTAELQHLFKFDRHSLVLGARVQVGAFNSRSQLGASTLTKLILSNNVVQRPWFRSPAMAPVEVSGFQRVGVYGYHNWQIFDPLLLTAGFSCDRLRYPLNYRFAPIAAGQDTVDQLCPKLGLTLTPARNTAIRAAYTRSLGGVSFEQSFRLEPSQIAGFNQAFRSLIPESVAASSAGERFETYGLALDQKFGRGTFVGLQLEELNAKADRMEGAVDIIPFSPFAASFARHTFRYRERSLVLTANQLVGECWSLGAVYRLSDARLADHYRDWPDLANYPNRFDQAATLQQLDLFGLFNHESGLFGRLDALWFHQANRGDARVMAGEDFWQFNVFVGYRFLRRRAEVKVGVLNLTDRDYRLNPLNLAAELPRQRTWMISLRLSF